MKVEVGGREPGDLGAVLGRRALGEDERGHRLEQEAGRRGPWTLEWGTGGPRAGAQETGKLAAAGPPGSPGLK